MAISEIISEIERVRTEDLAEAKINTQNANQYWKGSAAYNFYVKANEINLLIASTAEKLENLEKILKDYEAYHMLQQGNSEDKLEGRYNILKSEIESASNIREYKVSNSSYRSVRNLSNIYLNTDVIRQYIKNINNNDWHNTLGLQLKNSLEDLKTQIDLDAGFKIRINNFIDLIKAEITRIISSTTNFQLAIENYLQEYENIEEGKTSKVYEETVPPKSFNAGDQTVNLENNSQQSTDNTRPSSHTVQPGDTLWGIAKDILENEDENVTNLAIANFVSEIIATNKLDNGGTLIFAGQNLKIPGATSDSAVIAAAASAVGSAFADKANFSSDNPSSTSENPSENAGIAPDNRTEDNPPLEVTIGEGSQENSSSSETDSEPSTENTASDGAPVIEIDSDVPSSNEQNTGSQSDYTVNENGELEIPFNPNGTTENKTTESINTSNGTKTTESIFDNTNYATFNSEGNFVDSNGKVTGITYNDNGNIIDGNGKITTAKVDINNISTIETSDGNTMTKIPIIDTPNTATKDGIIMVNESGNLIDQGFKTVGITAENGIIKDGDNQETNIRYDPNSKHTFNLNGQTVTTYSILPSDEE